MNITIAYADYNCVEVEMIKELRNNVTLSSSDKVVLCDFLVTDTINKLFPEFLGNLPPNTPIVSVRSDHNRLTLAHGRDGMDLIGEVTGLNIKAIYDRFYRPDGTIKFPADTTSPTS